MRTLTILSAFIILFSACSSGGGVNSSSSSSGSSSSSSSSSSGTSSSSSSGTSSSSSSGGENTSDYSVGGVLSGLSSTVVLQDNGTDDISVGTSGPFTFPTSLAAGATYTVTVETPPSGQMCFVGNGTGMISMVNVANVTVTCEALNTTSYSVNGVLSGLSSTVVLQDNGTADISVDTNGPFTFPTVLATGAAYEVTVKTQPPGQSCVVGNGTGMISVVNINNVTVTCQAALAWDAPISDIDGSIVTSVAGYNLYYGTNPGVYTGSIDVGNTTQYAIADFLAAVPQGATYYICVTAYDAVMMTESACSNEITLSN